MIIAHPFYKKMEKRMNPQPLILHLFLLSQPTMLYKLRTSIPLKMKLPYMNSPSLQYDN